MRTIRRTTRFKKDFKREAKGRFRERVVRELAAVVTLLASDADLPERLRDHALGGEWADCRDCHVRPDLVLIYRKPDEDTIDLVRLGSHSELSL